MKISLLLSSGCRDGVVNEEQTGLLVCYSVPIRSF